MSDISKVLEKAPRDCWLALNKEETRVVGRGENLKEALKDAQDNGENDPVLIWAPKEWIPAVY